MEDQGTSNPFQEINYLFQHNFHLSPPTQSNLHSEEMHDEKELTEMMQIIHLEENIYQNKVNLAENQDFLMESPRNIKDLDKLKYFYPLSIPLQQFMQKNNKQANEYLYQLIGLLQKKQQSIKFQFVDVYPHSRNMVATCDINSGEDLIQLSQGRKLNDPKLKTLFQSFLEYIGIVDLKPLKASEQAKKRFTYKQISKFFNTRFSMSLFQRKFISYPESNKNEVEQPYFHLLPDNFDYHPLRERENIATFHKGIASQLENLHRQIVEQYTMIKGLIQGAYTTEQYSFRNFLRRHTPYGDQLFDYYLKMFTQKNYTWAKLCQKTRVYENAISFLDLFHHSDFFYNLVWQTKSGSNSLVLKARTNIQKGDLLYIQYNKPYMKMQQYYLSYGFVDVNIMTIYVDVPFQVNLELLQCIAREIDSEEISWQLMYFLKNNSIQDEIEKIIRINIHYYTTVTLANYKKQPRVQRRMQLLTQFVLAYTDLIGKLLMKMQKNYKQRAGLNCEKIIIKLRKFIESVYLTTIKTTIKQKQKDLQTCVKNLKANLAYTNHQMQREDSIHPQSLIENETRRFNLVYNYTAMKTIIRTQMKILQRILVAFEHPAQ